MQALESRFNTVRLIKNSEFLPWRNRFGFQHGWGWIRARTRPWCSAMAGAGQMSVLDPAWVCLAAAADAQQGRGFTQQVSEPSMLIRHSDVIGFNWKNLAEVL